MAIPTEPVGSIPRPAALIEAIAARGNAVDPALEPLFSAGHTRRMSSCRACSSSTWVTSTSRSREKPSASASFDMIRRHVKPEQRAFVGVVAPIEQLGTTDDCGFSPFADDTSTTRDTAFAKIRARVLGTALAAKALGRPP